MHDLAAEVSLDADTALLEGPLVVRENAACHAEEARLNRAALSGGKILAFDDKPAVYPADVFHARAQTGPDVNAEVPGKLEQLVRRRRDDRMIE
jgi:hypothetical protein